MPTYVSLLNWTDEGVKSFTDTVDRAAAAEEVMGKLGVTFKDIYWTLGPYDIVALVEAAERTARRRLSWRSPRRGTPAASPFAPSTAKRWPE